MSSSSDFAEIVTLYGKLDTEYYCIVAASVLFIYDTFVTFGREVVCFWTTKWSGAPLLFFANKWISIIICVMQLVQLAPFPSDERFEVFPFNCSVFQIVTIALVILQFVPWAAFSALRMFVLSKNKLSALLVLALSLAPVGANLVQYGYHVSGENLPPFNKCFETDTSTTATVLTLVIVSRVPLILADILLIYTTWTKLSTRDILRDLRQSKRLSLPDILFRDGTIYFVVLLILNVLHLALSATAIAGTGNGAESYVTLFTGPITAILVSRFLLELQEANQIVVRLDADDPLHFSHNPYDDTPSFIRSLGAVIGPELRIPPTSENSDFDSDTHLHAYLDEENGTQVFYKAESSL